MSLKNSPLAFGFQNLASGGASFRFQKKKICLHISLKKISFGWVFLTIGYAFIKKCPSLSWYIFFNPPLHSIHLEKNPLFAFILLLEFIMKIGPMPIFTSRSSLACEKKWIKKKTIRRRGPHPTCTWSIY